MTIKIQELESLQDLTEVELEKVVGGQIGPVPAEQMPPTFEELRETIDEIPPQVRRAVGDILDATNFFIRRFL